MAEGLEGFRGASVFLESFGILGRAEVMGEEIEKKKKEATKGRGNRWSNGAIGALIVVLLAVGISWAAAPKINLFSRINSKPCPCAKVLVFARFLFDLVRISVFEEETIYHF